LLIKKAKPGMALQTPVALIIFNRPDKTARVLEALAAVAPTRLLVVADGPRPGRVDDIEKCAATRALIDQITWDCEVLSHYSDENLGCGWGPASGISWVFEQVEEAILLEDDCVPDPTFFRYSEELLERYREDERVMLIAGTCFRPLEHITRYSYTFTRYTQTWGWATWRRAWRHFDFKVEMWPTLRNTAWLTDTLGDRRAAEYMGALFDEAYAGAGPVDFWDYQWTFACWAQSGLTIVPETNLVSNIGWGPDATHTLVVGEERDRQATHAMEFPLRHPPYVVRNREADDIIASVGYLRPGFYPWLRWRLSMKAPMWARKLRRRLAVR
jgi:hypothetical protein